MIISWLVELGLIQPDPPIPYTFSFTLEGRVSIVSPPYMMVAPWGVASRTFRRRYRPVPAGTAPQGNTLGGTGQYCLHSHSWYRLPPLQAPTGAPECLYRPVPSPFYAVQRCPYIGAQ
jgi:hypothetical protein